MPELVAIAYPEDSSAGRASAELDRCAEEWAFDPDAAAVVSCEHDGSSRLTTRRHPGATAHWSKFWGVVLGVVLNGGEASEIDPTFCAALRGLLRPGSSALLMILTVRDRDGILEALRPFGGTVLGCELAADVPRRWDVSGLRLDR